MDFRPGTNNNSLAIILTKEYDDFEKLMTQLMKNTGFTV